MSEFHTEQWTGDNHEVRRFNSYDGMMDDPRGTYVQVSDYRMLQQRHARLEEIATEILRVTHVGDQWFVGPLLSDEAKPIRMALVKLDNFFKEELEGEDE